MEEIKKTLEEAAEKFLIRQGCQRMDCDGEKCNFFEDVQPKDLIEFAKLQQEQMYSEEDLRNAFKAGREGDMVFNNESPKYWDFDTWFEQFKKNL